MNDVANDYNDHGDIHFKLTQKQAIIYYALTQPSVVPWAGDPKDCDGITYDVIRTEFANTLVKLHMDWKDEGNKAAVRALCAIMRVVRTKLEKGKE